VEEQHLQKENKNEIFSLVGKESRVESPPSPNSKNLDADISVCACNIGLRLCFGMRRHFCMRM